MSLKSKFVTKDSKLVSTAQKIESQNNVEKDVLFSTRENTLYPTSIRLRKIDINRLKKMVEKLSIITDRKLSQNEVFRALIYLGEQTKDETLLNSLRMSL